MENKEKTISEITEIFELSVADPTKIIAIDVVSRASNIDIATRHQTAQYNDLCMSKGVLVSV